MCSTSSSDGIEGLLLGLDKANTTDESVVVIFQCSLQTTSTLLAKCQTRLITDFVQELDGDIDKL
jgi:hypothetical protein